MMMSPTAAKVKGSVIFIASSLASSRASEAARRLLPPRPARFYPSRQRENALSCAFAATHASECGGRRSGVGQVDHPVQSSADLTGIGVNNTNADNT